MAGPETKQYIVVVQCDIVMERCSGCFCEQAFHDRTGGFAAFPKERPYRTLYLTCGGCCGRALGRKLSHLRRKLAKAGIAKEQIAVQLASCIVKDNFHGPPCPHLDYLKTLIARLGLDVVEGTAVSEKAEARRRDGVYGSGPADCAD
ncbi:MAG: CGGC domain-containing protein [Thermoguttaceae bacterium]|jgi:predicted metal-binding protein